MFASRSAILSANSPNEGSRASKGTEVDEAPWREEVGVVVEARRLVREGGRRGVVGREGNLRVRDAEREGGAEVGVVDAIFSVYSLVQLM